MTHNCKLIIHNFRTIAHSFRLIIHEGKVFTHDFRLIATICCLSLAAAVSAQTNDSAEEAFERGRLMVQHRQFKEATALWDSIAKLDITPDYKAKYLAINGILQRDSLHNTARALDYFRRAETLYPDIMKMRTKEVEKGVVYASMGLGIYADSLQQYTTAIEHYSKAIDLINHLLEEGIRGFDMSDFDLTIMRCSFELSRAIDYGHNHQFEDAEAAFGQLEYTYGQFELSPDIDMMIQGWLFGCLSRQQYILMCECEMQDTERALKETNLLLDKLLRGLSSDSLAIGESLSGQMPMFLCHAARITLKAGDPVQAVKLCDNAMTWAPDDEWKPQLINIKGKALVKQGKKEEARQCIEEVIKIAPNFYRNPQDKHNLQDKFGKK